MTAVWPAMEGQGLGEGNQNVLKPVRAHGFTSVLPIGSLKNLKAKAKGESASLDSGFD